MKRLSLIFGFLFTLALVLSIAKAGPVPPLTYTFNYPANASTLYNETTDIINVSITLNASVNESCEMMWENNGTLFTMTSNDTSENKTWFYEWTPPTSALNDDWRDLRYRCGNATANDTWSNATSLHMYRRKEATYTLLDRVITNNTILSSIPAGLNITVVSDNATNCTFNYNAAGEQSALMQQSPNREYWTNASALSWSDSAFGVQHNITYNCSDSCGNYSHSGMYFFKLDTATPVIEMAPIFTLGNYTSGGNYIEVEFNISDNNPGTCGATLYFEDGTNLNTTGVATYNYSLQYANCTINITPSDITKDGYAVVVGFTSDGAGNYNNTTSVGSQSYIFYRLKTGWNLVTGYENKTLSQIAGEFENVTYVSEWDNLNKSFSTFTTGSSTNANIQANFSSKYGAGSANIYVAADVVSMRRYYTPPASWTNATLYYNSTAARTSWNIVGVPVAITDLNASIMKNVCTNTTGSIAAPIGANCANITWVAWWDIQNSEFCSFYRNRLSAGCNYRSDQINLTRGDALWIAVQDGANMTLMRNSW